MEEILQVRPRLRYSEDVVYIIKPECVVSHEVSVMVSHKGFHEQVGKDCRKVSPSQVR